MKPMALRQSLGFSVPAPAEAYPKGGNPRCTRLGLHGLHPHPASQLYTPMGIGTPEATKEMAFVNQSKRDGHPLSPLCH